MSNNSPSQIPQLLNETIELLNRSGSEDWAAALERLLDEFAFDPEETKIKLRRLFGGMGSFNDLVLQNSDGMLRSENLALRRLKNELYAACGS